ncbi:MAG: ABC transporter permease [Pyrodictiaceae archaeon]
MDPLLAIQLGLLYASPLLLAAIGELYVERTGLVNLGIEGLMALGAAVAVLVGIETGSILLSYIVAGLAGLALSSIYVLLVVLLKADQIVVGLSIFFLGVGLGELVGYMTKGMPATPLAPLVARMDVVTLSALALAIASWIILWRTWLGYAIRSIGESEEKARALGVNVTATRIVVVLLAGFLAGLAGAHVVLRVFHARWYSGVTLGWGWIALGSVVLGYWHPLGIILATFLIGLLFSVVEPILASMGVPGALASSTPYLAVIAALALASLVSKKLGIHPPASVWRRD